LAIATGDNDVVPTITVEDAESEQPHIADVKAPQASTPAPPGTFGGAAGSIPDWYTVGWRQFAGIDKVSDAEQKDRSIIEAYLSEQYYGAWYHNAAIIIFVRHTVSMIPGKNLTRPSGCLCVTLSNPFRFRLGLAVHSPCRVQYILFYFHPSCAP
jgi:hypothetical protein